MGRRAWEGEDFFREWTKEAGAVGVEAALAHAEFTGRRGGLRGAVETWGRLEPELALAWLEGKAGVLTPEEQKVLLVRMVGGWSDRKPGESAEYVMGLEDEELFKSASEQVLRDWAAVDFEAAGTFVDGVEGNRQRQRRMEDQLVWAGRVRGNRAQALDYALEKYPENKLVSHSLYMVASEIIGNDPAGHVEWVRETTPDARMEEELFNTLLHQWRGIDRGEAARNWHLMPDPVRRANGYEFIAGIGRQKIWMRHGSGRMAWRRGPERERALTGVVTAWMGEDREGAQEWIGTLEEGELRDRTTSQLIPMMVKDDLAGALKLAEGLSHPHRRDDTLEYVMREWMKEDRAEAEVAIRSHEGLSEMARWRLLAGVEVER